MVDKKYLKLNDIESYKIAFKLSNYVWDIIVKWDYFAKDTVGKQFVRAIDSISANIAEGFGRYSKKDKIKFFRYSFGSLYESLDWNEKSHLRKLLNEEDYSYIFSELIKLPKSINSLILYTNKKLQI
ncbi:MAG: four helix bundle protein [Ignavibacteriales bacterium CG_4_9_14_3_um_filter_34_10]|nr:MAG: four helix bundle protein [Ignavibacteriales bacterium CG_4_9_14_3_um_filter_34_10]